MNYAFHKPVLVVVIQTASNILMVMIMKFSRKQPGDSGYKKTLDDLEGSLDFPPPSISTENNNHDKNNNIGAYDQGPIHFVIWLHGSDGKSLMKPDCRAMNPKACPEGHILKDEMGGCLFHMDIDYKSPGPYKRRDIGADYGGSGSL